MRIGYYTSFEIAGRKKKISGIVLDHNEEWVLLNRWNEGQADGYTVFRRKHIFAELSCELEEDEINAALARAAPDHKKVVAMPITDLASILNHIGENYALLQLEVISASEPKNASFIGREGDVFYFKELTSKMRWRHTFVLQQTELNFINFGNSDLLQIKKELYN